MKTTDIHKTKPNKVQVHVAFYVIRPGNGSGLFHSYQGPHTATSKIT